MTGTEKNASQKPKVRKREGNMKQKYDGQLCKFFDIYR